METAERILRSFVTWAVVGASTDPTKPGARVPGTLQAHGFRIVPVNPHAKELFGERVYPDLESIPFPVEVVQVFRPSAEAADWARRAVAIGAKALWLQLGIESEEAREIAEAAGLAYVEDRCAAVERSIHAIEHSRPGA